MPVASRPEPASVRLALMTAPRALANLRPRRLIDNACSLDLIEFLARYGDSQLLLVRIPDGDTELELGLDAAAPNTGSVRPGPFPFHTGLQTPPRAWRSESERARREDPGALWLLLEKHAYFVVPVRKRADSDALFMGRISIGRARNKDIVLRHSTISKFHAWFEADDAENLHVFDAGSTNLTHVNGQPIEARARTAIEPGDAIRFGAVETLVCSPAAFWACLDLEKAGGAATKGSVR
jgi:FHA domain